MNITTKRNIELDLSFGEKITDLTIERVQGNYLFTKDKNYQKGILKLEGKKICAKEIVSPSFTYITNYTNDIAIALTEVVSVCLIDNEGQILTKNYYNHLKHIYNNYYQYSSINNYGIMDKDENVILKSKTEIDCEYQNGYFIVSDSHNKNSLYDLKGKQLIKSKYEQMTFIDKNLLVVDKKDRAKVVDIYGKTILKLPKMRYLFKMNNQTQIGTYNGYYIIVKDNSFMGPYLGTVRDIFNGKALVDRGSKCYIIDDNNKVLTNIPGEYQFGLDNQLSYFIDNGKSFIANLDGNIYSFETDGYEPNESINKKAIIGFKSKRNEFLCQLQNNRLNIIREDSILGKTNDNQILLFDRDNLKGLMNDQGKEIVIAKKDKLSKIDFQRENQTILYSLTYYDTKLNHSLEPYDEVNTKYGIVDINGKELVPLMSAKNMFLLNEEKVIVDGFIYQISDLKNKYKLNIEIDYENKKENYQIVFDNNLDLIKYEKNIYQNIQDYIKKDNSQTKVKTLENNGKLL